MSSFNYAKRLLPYSLSFVIPVFAMIGILEGGIYTFLNVALVFMIVPAAELLLRDSGSNIPEPLEESFRQRKGFTLFLLLHIILQYSVIAVFFSALMTYDYSTAELAGIVLTSAISLGGIGITVAHELIHRKERILQFAGELLLLPVLYIHFTIEHVRGHHKHVATQQDPATAVLGESLPAFWWKSVSGSYISAWRIENNRLRTKNLPAASLRNTMVWYTLATVLFFGILFMAASTEAFLLYIVTAVLSFTLLEIVNYIEHYGLERLEKTPGKFEKVEVHHSWNSNTYLSRYFLFELTRHSDHHMNASREYQILRDFEESPRHPTGYPGMILLALVPPLWKKVMDPLVKKTRSQ